MGQQGKPTGIKHEILIVFTHLQEKHLYLHREWLWCHDIPGRHIWSLRHNDLSSTRCTSCHKEIQDNYFAIIHSDTHTNHCCSIIDKIIADLCAKSVIHRVLFLRAHHKKSCLNNIARSMQTNASYVYGKIERGRERVMWALRKLPQNILLNFQIDK